MASHRIVVNGTPLWCEHAGDGPAVVLLHAGGADSRMWDHHFECFPERFHTIRFDLPGAGRSPFPESAWNGIELVEGVLDALQVARAAVVGMSMGGGLAVDFAIQRPDRTWALVAVACGPRVTREEDAGGPLPRQAEMFAALMAGDPDRATEIFVDVWCPVPGSPQWDVRMREMTRQNIMMLTQLPKGLVKLPDWSASERLGEIRAPTLVMWGDQDVPQVKDGGQRIAAGVADARQVVLPGVDHFVPLRALQAFGAEVLAFLDEVAPEV